MAYRWYMFLCVEVAGIIGKTVNIISWRLFLVIFSYIRNDVVKMEFGREFVWVRS